MNELKVAIIQTRLHWQDPEKNREWMEKKLEEIHGRVDVIVLPEMFSTGFTMDAAHLAETMEGPSIRWMADTAAGNNAAVTGSLIIKDGSQYYNRLIWMLPDGTCEFYDKRHLFRMADEHQHFGAGSNRLIVHFRGWKICPMVCYDLRFPIWSRNRFVNGEYDYDCLIYVANWPARRSHAWKTLLPARAIENQAYVIGVNRIGLDGNEINYSGDSAVIDFKGERLSKTERFGDKTEVVAISMNELNEFRKSFPVLLDGDFFEIKP